MSQMASQSESQTLTGDSVDHSPVSILNEEYALWLGPGSDSVHWRFVFYFKVQNALIKAGINVESPDGQKHFYWELPFSPLESYKDDPRFQTAIDSLRVKREDADSIDSPSRLSLGNLERHAAENPEAQPDWRAPAANSQPESPEAWDEASATLSAPGPAEIYPGSPAAEEAAQVTPELLRQVLARVEGLEARVKYLEGENFRLQRLSLNMNSLGEGIFQRCSNMHHLGEENVQFQQGYPNMNDVKFQQQSPIINNLKEETISLQGQHPIMKNLKVEEEEMQFRQQFLDVNNLTEEDIQVRRGYQDILDNLE